MGIEYRNTVPPRCPTISLTNDSVKARRSVRQIPTQVLAIGG